MTTLTKYIPLREFMQVEPTPCEHCDNGTVRLDNGRSFPCCYCDGTGEGDPDENRLRKTGLAVYVCDVCQGTKRQNCSRCHGDGCDHCDWLTIEDCDNCGGFGYIFVDSRDREGLPRWAISYANDLISLISEIDW